MNLDIYTTVLMIIAPSVSTVLTVIFGFIALAKTLKSIIKNNKDTVTKSSEKISNLEKKLNIANAKLASIEKFLQEKERR